MGITTRRCLVKYKKRKLIENPHDKRASNYAFCQLSAHKLKRPIIASRMGRLFNKQDAIEYLLDRGGQEPKPGEVDKLPDNRNYKTTEEDDREVTNAFPFICPITGYEMN